MILTIGPDTRVHYYYKDALRSVRNRMQDGYTNTVYGITDDSIRVAVTQLLEINGFSVHISKRNTRNLVIRREK